MNKREKEIKELVEIYIKSSFMKELALKYLERYKMEIKINEGDSCQIL